MCVEGDTVDRYSVHLPEPNIVKRFQDIIAVTDEDYHVVQYNFTDVSKEMSSSLGYKTTQILLILM
jgi:hypothetical protein